MLSDRFPEISFDRRMSTVGRHRQFATFGCSRSHAISTRSAVAIPERPLSSNSVFLDAAGERQVPRWTCRSPKRPPKSAFGSRRHSATQSRTAAISLEPKFDLVLRRTVDGRSPVLADGSLGAAQFSSRVGCCVTPRSQLSASAWRSGYQLAAVGGHRLRARRTIRGHIGVQTTTPGPPLTTLCLTRASGD